LAPEVSDNANHRRALQVTQLPFAQQHHQRSTLLVANRVTLGVQAAFGAPDTSGKSPFLSRLAAVQCALRGVALHSMSRAQETETGPGPNYRLHTIDQFLLPPLPAGKHGPMSNSLLVSSFEGKTHWRKTVTRSGDVRPSSRLIKPQLLMQTYRSINVQRGRGQIDDEFKSKVR
jgi:hypothetical protein